MVSQIIGAHYVVAVIATSMVDLLITGFTDSLSFHLNFYQVMFYTPYHTLVVLCSFLIFSSRHHEISVLLHVITRSKISFHVHAGNVDHAITCEKGSFHAVTSNKSANHASCQIVWGATTLGLTRYTNSNLIAVINFRLCSGQGVENWLINTQILLTPKDLSLLKTLWRGM